MGDVLQLAVAVAGGALIFKAGLAIMRSLARPLPPPPPPGELRRIRLRYRCSICGMELRVDRATEELPDPPRHCQEEMDLVAPVDD